ncbi:MAG: acyl-CoA dehydrogenase family protein, partial [Hyphomonadaceae bacterium]
SGREGHFNEVFFDDVRVPASYLLGQEGDGWRLTMQMLQSERLMIARVGNGPSARTLVQGLRKIGKLKEPGYRDEAAKLYVEGEMIRLLQLRNLSDQLNARRPGPEAAAMKMLGAPHIQKVLEFAKRVHGQAGLVEAAEWYPEANTSDDSHGFARDWDHGYWFSPAMTLMVGTQEIMRNVIGERVLGLPRELDPSAKGDWSEMSKKARAAAAA